MRVKPPRRVVLWPDAPAELRPARPVPDDPAKVPPDELAGWLSEAYGVPLEDVLAGPAMVSELVRLAGVRVMRFAGLWRQAVLPVRLDYREIACRCDGGVELRSRDGGGLRQGAVWAALVREEQGWRPYWRPGPCRGADVPDGVPAVPALFWIGEPWEGGVAERASGDVRRRVLGAEGLEAPLEVLRGHAVRVRLPEVGGGCAVQSEPFVVESFECEPGPSGRVCLRGPGPVFVELPVGVRDRVGWDLKNLVLGFNPGRWPYCADLLI
ncbi:MAG: hypothetical protein AB1816_10880 [Bacillota bacterium]